MATMEDTSSSNHPLYLHQNDNPGLILISKKLTGTDNYNSSRRSIMIALNAKNKLKIVTKEFKEPEVGSENRALWERNNDMIISWILNTVTDQISNSLTYVNLASDLWLELQEHYSQIDGHRIYQLMNEITQLKQQDCTIEVYYHKLKGLWDELDALETPYTCICICTCENGKVNGERELRKRLLQFLMGLDDSYSNIRGQILLMQPLPTPAKAYGMVKQEEKQREGILAKPLNPTVMSFSLNNNPKQFTSKAPNPTGKKSNFKKGIFCNYCKKEGHAKDECYKIVGYPQGHPLHGKVLPKGNAKRAVNMVFGGNEAFISPIEDHNNTNSENAMFAKIDLLQNQVNQVMMMMQHNQIKSDSSAGQQEEACPWQA